MTTHTRTACSQICGREEEVDQQLQQSSISTIQQALGQSKPSVSSNTFHVPNPALLNEEEESVILVRSRIGTQLPQMIMTKVVVVVMTLTTLRVLLILLVTMTMTQTQAVLLMHLSNLAKVSVTSDPLMSNSESLTPLTAKILSSSESFLLAATWCSWTDLNLLPRRKRRFTTFYLTSVVLL